MKKILITIAVIFMMIGMALATQKTLTFQWNQDVMATGDKWEMHVSETAGGPYAHLADILFVSQQTDYTENVSADIPIGGYYFVLRKVAANGDKSGWSNEIFYTIVNSPFQLKLIFKP